MTGGPDSAVHGIALAVFAHPDDETLLAGALIPKLIDDGWRVHLLCVAPGDDDDRSARMELAAAELGIESVSSLRFGPANERSSDVRATASPSLLSAPESAVANQIEGKIAAVSPKMILTHSASGDYGHPDHVFCHRIAVAAAENAAPEAKVLALAWPRRALMLNRVAERLLRLPGAKARTMGRRTDLLATGEEMAAELPVTETHDVRRFLGLRKRAARHYRKEIAQGPLPLRMLESAPTWLQRFVLGKARLSRVR